MGKPIYWLFYIPSLSFLPLFVHVSPLPCLSYYSVDSLHLTQFTVAILLRNRIPLAQERAALSAALYHAAIDFVSRAPMQVAKTPSRFFEAVSNFFPHLRYLRLTRHLVVRPDPHSSSSYPLGSR